MSEHHATDERAMPPLAIENEVEEAGAESFPASDPPAWNRGKSQDPSVVDPSMAARPRQADERAERRPDAPQDGRCTDR